MGEQRVDRAPGVKIAPPLLRITECQEHLCRLEAALSKNILISMRQRNLTDSGSRLTVLQFQWTVRQTQDTSTKRDGARRNKHDLTAIAIERRNIIRK